MEIHNKTLPASATQNLYLEGLHRDADEVLHASEALFASLTPAQLCWQPGKRKWSILQCFDHLLVTNALYMALISDAMEEAKVRSAEAILPFKASMFGKWFIDTLRPDSKFKTRTFRIFKPESAPDDLTVTSRFIDQQRALLKLIQQADQCDLNNVKLASPVSRLFRFSIGEALTIVVVHEQRHLLQAQNIQLLADFPEFQA